MLSLCRQMDGQRDKQYAPNLSIRGHKQEKMLVTSIFSFSHNVFYHSQNKFQFLRYFHVVVCKCFQFGQVPYFVIWYLTLSQTSPGFYMSAVLVFWKHCGKRRNSSSRAISPFPTMFFTRLENFLPFLSNLKLSSAKSFSLEESKICCLGKG